MTPASTRWHCCLTAAVMAVWWRRWWHTYRLMVQSRVRGWLKYIWYTRTKRSTIKLQAWWRMLLAMWEKCRLMRTKVLSPPQQEHTVCGTPLCLCLLHNHAPCISNSHFIASVSSVCAAGPMGATRASAKSAHVLSPDAVRPLEHQRIHNSAQIPRVPCSRAGTPSAFVSSCHCRCRCRCCCC